MLVRQRLRPLLRERKVRSVRVRQIVIARQALRERLKVRRFQLCSLLRRKKASEQRKSYDALGPKVLQPVSLSHSRPDSSQIPSHEAETFWTDILGNPGSCKLDSPYALAWRDLCGRKVTDPVDVEEIPINIWSHVLKKLRPWKAPGADKIQGFWWKTFSHTIWLCPSRSPGDTTMDGRW